MRNNRTLVVKNEMRTVEDAKRNETYGTDTRDIRDDSYFKKSTATRNEQRWGHKNSFILYTNILWRCDKLSLCLIFT